MPIAIVTVASAATCGQTRFRVPAEPSLVILAGIALAALVTARPPSQSTATGSP
ncbi:MAG: hypothetical protein ACR2IR_12490 [Acidimicrobiia bacterium]